jgi:hypothetical protein
MYLTNPFELAVSTIKKQNIVISDMKRIDVADQNFYRRTGGKSLYLVHLTKGKGKRKQSVLLSVLSDEPPTPETALVKAFRENRFFNSVPLYEFLGCRQYNALAEAAVSWDEAS